MANIRMAGALAVALTVLGSLGCSPASPAPIPGGPPPPPPFLGEITVSEIVPGPGATLSVRDCGNSRLCADQFRTTFDVLMPTDVQDAWVIVTLGAGSAPCASAFIRTTLTANTRASFSVSSIAMDWDEEGHLLCSLPVETSRLSFSIYRNGAPANAVVSREMPYRLTLAATSGDAR
jgi:hypothetical protein